MEASNIDGCFSFNSTEHSTFALTEKENQIEQLKRKVRVLESDKSELLSTVPRLKNLQGKDCTEEMIKLNKELLLVKEQSERWRNDYMDMSMRYENLEKASIAQFDQKDKQIAQFRNQAMEMEEENGKLQEKLQNEKSRVWHLQRGDFVDQLATPKAVQNKEMDDQFATPKAMQNKEVIPATISPKTHNQMTDTLSKMTQIVDVVDETYTCNVDDADQIAMHLLMILETLDKNQRDNSELQNEIFTFLAVHGICPNNPEKLGVLNSVYKKVTDKRLAEIRVGNEQFHSNITIGDKDLDECMKHLAVQDSITFSSMPSFAGFSKEIALQFETSSPEIDNDQNVTSGSVFAANMTFRTSTLLEVCMRMFEKLRGTVEFFQNLFKLLGGSAEALGEDIAKKLEAMKLDLDFSIGEAQSMLSERSFAIMEEPSAQIRVEKEQMNELSAEIEMMRKKQQDMEEKQQQLEQLLAEEREKIAKVMAERDAFEQELRDREDVIVQLNDQKQELQKRMEEINQAKQTLQLEIEKMTKSDLKDKVLEHSRAELNKIFDTMQFTMSSCNSVVSSLGKKKVKIAKKQPAQDNKH